MVYCRDEQEQSLETDFDTGKVDIFKELRKKNNVWWKK